MEQGYKSTRLAQALAGLSQSVAILRLFQGEGFDHYESKNKDGKLEECCTFNWLEQEVLRLQSFSHGGSK